MNTVVPALGTTISDVRLDKGSHVDAKAGMCAMELASVLAGEPFSDTPQCVSSVIACFMRNWNDALDDTTRQFLKPCVLKALNTVDNNETETARSYMALDWLIRSATPAWLELAGLAQHAVALRNLAPIVDMVSATNAREVVYAANDAANDAAYAAASAAARAAAYAAANAAAYAAARAAASAAARAAASAAAYAAAYAAANAAANDAANAAAYAANAAAYAAANAAANAKLQPTVEQLQQSAFDLLDRMVALHVDNAREAMW